MQTVLPPIPGSLRENLAFNLGGPAQADAWLADAARVAGALLRRWDLRPLEVLSGGGFSLCVKCADGCGAPLVLKVPASVESGAVEVEALRAWGGNGAARLLRTDPETSSMLMNYLGRVGEGSYGLGDILDLADRLHVADPAAGVFPDVATNLDRRVDWALDRFAARGQERHREDLELARKLVADLRGDDVERPVLLHGDLQEKNLIVHDGELTAVDPMPVLGPAVFDVAFWIAKSPLVQRAQLCVEEVTRLRPGLDPDRLMRWTWVLSVLENRPLVERGAVQRQQFIDVLRDCVVG